LDLKPKLDLDFARIDDPVQINPNEPHSINDQNRQISDKQIKVPKFLKFIASLSPPSSWFSVSTNLFVGLMQLLSSIKPEFKKITEKISTSFTQLSYVPYALDGMLNGIKKKNFFQSLGFFGELILPWFANTKNMYLIRGMATGTDQVWVATEDKHKDRFKDGYFPDWITGIKETVKSMFELGIEIIENPISTLLSKEPKGHLAALSSFGGVSAAFGYLLSGSENIFGPIRDLSASAFDFDLLKYPERMLAGVAFIMESVFDLVARWIPDENIRLAINHFSQAAGRYALEAYKNSDPAAKK
jgi:hypothetical protein